MKHAISLILGLVLIVAIDTGQAEAATNRISSGYAHTCAITSAGALKCWGYNGNGQLGIGNIYTGDPGPAYTSTPTQVNGMTSGVTYVVAGSYNTCAIQNGVLKCWGDNTYGQLGAGYTGAQLASWPSPVTVYTGSFSSTATSVALGTWHVCAQIDYSYPSTYGGDVYCWGRNLFGQLGNGSGVDAASPVPVTNSSTYSLRSLSSGDSHMCAIGNVQYQGATNQGVFCWGNNNYLQVSPVVGNKSTPTLQDMAWVRNSTSIVTSNSYSCNSDGFGNTVCWGYAPYMNSTATAPANARVVTGDPYRYSTMYSGLKITNWPIEAAGGVNRVKASSFYSGGRDGYQMIYNYKIVGGGYQEFCRLGNGVCTATNVNTFSAASETKVNSTTNLANPSELSEGTWHGCAMAPDLTAPYTQRPYCWGYNIYGQTGVTPSTQVAYATVVPGTW